MRKGTFTHSGTALTDSRLIISKWFNRQWMLLNPLHRRPCKQAGFSVQHQPIIWVACGRAKGFKGIFGRLNHSTGGWRDRLSSLAPVWGGDTVPPSYIMKTFLDTPGIYCGGKKQHWISTSLRLTAGLASKSRHIVCTQGVSQHFMHGNSLKKDKERGNHDKLGLFQVY